MNLLMHRYNMLVKRGFWMKKEDLIKLKEKITDLSNEEKKLRNLYLKKMALGELYGPLMGQASIDKPWLGQYTDEDILSDINDRSMYQDLLEYSKNNLDNIAIEYFGKKITYRELIENIEITAASLVKDGVKEHDKVSVSMPYLPETIYTIYALNKIGAVVNMIDPRINPQLITEYINKAESRYAIVIDKIEKKIEKILPKVSLEKVVSVSPMLSHGNPFIRFINKFKKSKFTKWEEFFDRNAQRVETVNTKGEDLAVIEYTSGTSGDPKGVMLGNKSFVGLAHFQHESLKNKVGDKFLLIMPPFIAYGLVIGMHDMLCQGQHLLMIPNFTLDKAPKMLSKLIDKYHPEYIMGVPNFLTILMNYKNNLSFLKGMIIGGDHLDAEIERQARKFLASRNSNAQICKGWGMTEIASCGTFTKTDGINNIGSVGIPLSKNNVKILKTIKDDNARYDIDEVEIGYGEEGTLFISSPTMTLGYYKKEEATNKVVYVDGQGNKWINTGDIFSISQDGSLYFKGREKRIVVRPDGHNIPSNQIESISNSFDEVRNSVVVGVPSKSYAHGSMAADCILTKSVLTDKDKEQLLKKIEVKCKKNLQPRDRAKYYVVVDKIPYTSNGKVDYINLTKEVSRKLDELIVDENSQESFYIFDKTDKNVKKRVRRK